MGSPITFMMRPRHSGPTGMVMGAPVSVTFAIRATISHKWTSRDTITHLVAANQTLSTVHGDGSNRRLTEMLGDFEDESRRAVLDFERVENVGQVAIELHVHDGTDNGHNSTNSWRASDFGCGASSLLC